MRFSLSLVFVWIFCFFSFLSCIVVKTNPKKTSPDAPIPVPEALKKSKLIDRLGSDILKKLNHRKSGRSVYYVNMALTDEEWEDRVLYRFPRRSAAAIVNSRKAMVKRADTPDFSSINSLSLATKAIRSIKFFMASGMCTCFSCSLLSRTS